jgi:microcystin-dependent protein
MSWDTSTPAGSEAANNGDNRIRELKVDLQTSLRGAEPDGTVAKFPGSDTASPKYHYRGGHGTEAARPASGDYGLYANTSNGHLQRDNGTSWDNIATLIPPGLVAPYAGASSPNGWLACDGTAISRTTYSALFAAIGVAHGTGDGSTTFNLPDYRGRFLRGVDGSAGNDPDKASRTAMASGGNTGNTIGSVQADGNKSHTHVQDSHTHPVTISDAVRTGGGVGALGLGFSDLAVGISSSATTSATTATNQNEGESDARPKNAYVNFIIKT